MIHSSFISRGVSWKMQGVEFKADMLVMPLCGNDVVLGIQWLIILGDIRWNFKLLKIEFTIGSKKVSLRGSQPGKFKVIGDVHMSRMLSQPKQLNMVTVTFVQTVLMGNVTINSDTKEDMQQLLDKYSDLLVVPTSLPPHRDHDHRIILKEGVPPVNVRPYRYAVNQKDEIEKLITKMLDAGIIRPSVSPFSSPIVMIKKKDGSWRLCIDYRQLNKIMLKTNFLSL